jgi:hypothetical protein
MNSPGGEAEADDVWVSPSILEQKLNSVNMIREAYFILLETGNNLSGQTPKISLNHHFS